jgi:TonB family protein
MKNFLILTGLVASSAASLLYADDKPLFAPRPVKNATASKQHCQGAGIFEMVVDKPSGKVKEVFVRSSTNNVLLDADVINTLLQWRFQPNSESSIRIPVAFTADNDTAFYPVGQAARITNRGLPYPFKASITPGKLWQWFSEFYGAAGHR